MNGKVLDASVILAVAFAEPGARAARSHLAESFISAVNWSEFVQKATQRGVDHHQAATDAADAGVTVMDFGTSDAMATAELWQSSRAAGLSLGDRACLALAVRMGLPAITMDRAWSRLDIGVEVVVVSRERNASAPGSPST